jgi:hypothetical protein
MKAIIITICLFGLTFGLQMRQFGDTNEVHDKEHLKQHLENKIDVDNAQLNPEQERFHYFSMHDLNQDGVIDGIELIKLSFLLYFVCKNQNSSINICKTFNIITTNSNQHGQKNIKC